MYVQDSLEAEPKVLIDPNALSDDGTVSLRSTSWSHDGNILAYGMSVSGSDWMTIKFRNIETGQVFVGFFYCHIPTPTTTPTTKQP